MRFQFARESPSNIILIALIKLVHVLLQKVFLGALEMWQCLPINVLISDVILKKNSIIKDKGANSFRLFPLNYFRKDDGKHGQRS